MKLFKGSNFLIPKKKVAIILNEVVGVKNSKTFLDD